MSSAKDREEFLLEERARIDAELTELRSEPEPDDERLVPDFVMDVGGEYGGNAYPEAREYRVKMVQSPTNGIVMGVSDSSDNMVGVPLVITEELADGIMRMASTDHTLSGYEDDWKLPDGMERTVSWMLDTDADVMIVLNEDQIEEVGTWLRYATGNDYWNWETDGEVYDV
jgi:hypothetical protein